MPTTPRRYSRWTAADDEAVRTLPPAVAARRLGRTVGAVHQRRYVLGAADLKRRWTAAEDRLVMRLPADAAARSLGRTTDAVKTRRRDLGLTAKT